MSEPLLHRFADAEQICRAAADEFVRCGRAAQAEHGRFLVALSGGSTPRRLFEILAAPLRDQLDWPRVEFFWGDERCVPPDHPDSNFHMASAALLRKVPVAQERIHRIQAEADDLDVAAGAYQAEIARVFGVPPSGAPPSFDLVLLGMGADGHTASLFPHTSGLKETKRWVVPNHVPRLNTNRVTLTPRILNQAAEVWFLVAGADKAVPLAEVLEGPPDSERLPSQLIRPVAGKLVWYVDEAAAARLRSR